MSDWQYLRELLPQGLVLTDQQALSLADSPDTAALVEIAATFRPRKRARITSGTVDMPTASPPRILIARISAGVSKDGPEYQA